MIKDKKIPPKTSNYSQNYPMAIYKEEIKNKMVELYELIKANPRMERDLGAPR